MLRVITAAARERIENPESFVFRVAANLLHDRRRQYLRDGEPDHIPIDDALQRELEANLLEERSPERVLLDRESLYAALRRLDALDKRTRNIFILFKLENMKQKDIAKLYGIGQSTVEKLVTRAMLHLMKRHGRP
jgi:RNA polymerase sigma-70 factor (ECF subfamily)